MPADSSNGDFKGTGYELFILLLSLVSIFNLGIQAVGEYFGVADYAIEVIGIINALLTVFFVFDFLYRFLTTTSRYNYFFRNWGWTDLLACIPTFRIFRLFRIVRAARLLRRFGPKNMLKEISGNRAGSALYLSIFGIILVVQVAAVVVLRVESGSPSGNITTAGDAVWWVFVTLTTVGYGDLYPSTGSGRVAAVFVMFAGVALIGVLASYLSSFFLESGPKPVTVYEAGDPESTLLELKSLLDQQQTIQKELERKIAEIEQML